MVNEEKFQSNAVTLTLIGQCPMLNSSEPFSYATICSSSSGLNHYFYLSCTQPPPYIELIHFSCISMCSKAHQLISNATVKSQRVKGVKYQKIIYV